MQILKLLIILLIWRITETNAFRAFDCSHNETTFRAFSLLEVDECPNPTTGYKPPVNISLQVILSQDVQPLNTIQCHVVISKEVVSCGFDSITYGSVWPIWEKTVKVDKQECYDAYKYNSMVIEGHKIYTEPNRQINLDFFSHGEAKPTGYCTRASFVSEGIQFNGHYERVYLRVRISSQVAEVDYAEDLLKVKGVKTSFSRGFMHDATLGTFIWDSSEPSCTDKLSLIYSGPATYTVAKDQTTSDNFVILSNVAEDLYAGLVQKESIKVCGKGCYKTQLAGVSMCINSVGEQTIKNLRFKPGTPKEVENNQAQMAFLHIQARLDWSSQLVKIYSELCQQQRMILSSRLQSLAAANSPYALNDILGAGHEVFPAGAALYITKCVAFEAVKVDFPNCTREIPALNPEGEMIFVDPVSWISKSMPTIFPCNEIMPTRWQINDIWYCATPKTTVCSAPAQLTPKALDLEIESITHGLNGGLWSEKQRKENKDFQEAAHIREPAIQEGANNKLGTKNYSVRYLTDWDVPNIVGQVGAYFNLDFLGVGSLVIPIIGFLVFIAIVKAMIETVIRVIHAYSVRGCGWYLCAAVWDTLWNIFGIPVIIMKQSLKTATEPMQKALNKDKDEGKAVNNLSTEVTSSGQVQGGPSDFPGGRVETHNNEKTTNFSPSAPPQEAGSSAGGKFKPSGNFFSR